MLSGWLRCAAVVVIVGSAVAGSAAAAASPVEFSDGGVAGVVEPADMTVGEESHATWSGVNWTDWTSSSAHGVAASYQGFTEDAATPNAPVTFSRPKPCGSVRIFTQLDTVTPAGTRDSVKLGCAIRLGAQSDGTSGLGEYEPDRIWFGGDASTTFFSLHWKHWGQSTAIATGRGYWRAPYGHSVRVRVTATRGGVCDGMIAYRRISITYPGHGKGAAHPSVC